MLPRFLTLCFLYMHDWNTYSGAHTVFVIIVIIAKKGAHLKTLRNAKHERSKQIAVALYILEG